MCIPPVAYSIYYVTLNGIQCIGNFSNQKFMWKGNRSETPRNATWWTTKYTATVFKDTKKR